MGSEVKILTFTLDDAGTSKDLFLSLGDQLYKDDPNYLGPSAQDLSAFLDKERNPIFEYIFSRFFVALDKQGNILGRVAALINSRITNGEENVPRFMLGYFECVEEYCICKQLLDAALTWLQEQGAQRVWGPMNGSIWTPHRFKLSHFDERTFATEPYNKSYYPSYFERYGFELKEKWFSRRMDRSVLDSYFAPQKERLDKHRTRVLERGFRLEWSRREDFASDLKQLYLLLTDSYQEFWGYSPIECHEFCFLNAKMVHLLIEDELILKIWKGDELMAAAISHPARLEIQKESVDMVFHNAVSAAGRKGMNALGNILVYSCFEKVKEVRFPYVIYPVMYEGNKAIMNLSAGDQAQLIGTYGMFCIDLSQRS